MEGRSPEFTPNLLEHTDDGFSEAKSAKIVEGKGMDTKQVKKRKPIVTRTTRLIRPAVRSPRAIRQGVVVSPVASVFSRREKIVKAYKENAQAIISLVEVLQSLNGTNVRQEEQILDEIKEKQQIQQQLVHALVLEQRHQLTEEGISKEAWNLVK